MLLALLWDARASTTTTRTSPFFLWLRGLVITSAFITRFSEKKQDNLVVTIITTTAARKCRLNSILTTN